MNIQEQLTATRASHRRGQVISYVLYGFTFVFLVFGIYVYSALEDHRERRINENAQSDVLVCARANYQDVRDRLQDQLLLDIVTAGVEREKSSVKIFKAAERQLTDRLRTQPPSISVLLSRWRGAPTSEGTNEMREMEAAGPQARAEARDRGDLIESPVNCDKLPSQRPFER